MDPKPSRPSRPPLLPTAAPDTRAFASCASRCETRVASRPRHTPPAPYRPRPYRPPRPGHQASGQCQGGQWACRAPSTSASLSTRPVAPSTRPAREGGGRREMTPCSCVRHPLRLCAKRKTVAVARVGDELCTAFCTDLSRPEPVQEHRESPSEGESAPVSPPSVELLTGGLLVRVQPGE